MASFIAKVIFGYQEVSLEVFFSDGCVIVDGDVDSGKDEVFGEFGIDAIGRGDEHSEAKQPL